MRQNDVWFRYTLDIPYMPRKVLWASRLDEIAAQLGNLPERWMDRSTLEAVLGVSRRGAQRILSACAGRRVGASNLADRDEVIAHLRQLVNGETSYYERRRRMRLAGYLNRARETLLQPKVLVPAPVRVLDQRWDELPDGIAVTPGQIAIRFETSVEALEKLLALALAIGNDQERFERLASESDPAPSTEKN
jgi:hypothetical protein